MLLMVTPPRHLPPPTPAAHPPPHQHLQPHPPLPPPPALTLTSMGGGGSGASPGGGGGGGGDTPGSSTEEMSDEGSSPGSGGVGEQKMGGVGGSDICRDFLRNVCKRGKRCKFRHPDTSEARQLGRKRHEYTFCHDFQNSGCRRANCRFIHCSREEEEYYKQTGQLPVRLQQAAALGIGVLPNELPLMRGEVPICKDFLKGECKRGARCKFRHISPAEYDLELRRTTNPAASGAPPAVRTAQVATPRLPAAAVGHVDPPPGIPGFCPELYDEYINPGDSRYADTTPKFTNPYENVLKKRRVDEMFTTTDDLHYNLRAALPPATGTLGNGTLTATDYRLLEEENAMLRRKVEELKKQVSDLVATNDVLLEQNARYRSSKAAQAGQQIVTSAAASGGALVTVSQVMTPVSSLCTVSRVAGSVAAVMSAMPPIAAAQPINPLSTTVNTLPAQLRLDQTSQAPQTAATDIAIATGVSQRPDGAPATLHVPVSMAPMDTSTMAPGSIAQTVPPVVVSTLVESLPGAMPAPVASLSQQQQTSIAAILQQGHSQTAGATLVSYPIMSHSLTPAQIRPVNSSALG